MKSCGDRKQHYRTTVLLLSCMWLAHSSAADRSSPASYTAINGVMVQQLAAYSMCGGKSNCASGQGHACADQAQKNIQCPSGYSCQRHDEWYWRCLPDTILTSNATGSQLDASAFVYGSRVEPLPPWSATLGTAITDNGQPSGPFVSAEQYLSEAAGTGKGKQYDTGDSASAVADIEQSLLEGPASNETQPGIMAPSPSLPITATNNYYLLTYSADPLLRPLVLETLDGAVNLKYKVIRMWAFADGPGWNHLQIAPGMYDKRVMDAFDWLMGEAAKRGLKFMMTLTNHWNAYGGIAQYVRWADGLPDNAEVPNIQFFYNTKAKQYFRNYAKVIVTRYRKHPAVHSWDLINQPRADGDTGGGIPKWITATAAFVRRFDTKHPITVGADGFFGPSTPDYLRKNPYTQDSGNDFIAECQSLDFCSFHMYPDHWLPRDTTVDQKVDWCEQWILDHVAAAKKYLKGRPVMMSEYNIEPFEQSQEKMSRMVSRVYLHAIKTGVPLGGAMIWWLSSPNYQYNDGYSLLSDGKSEVAKIQRAMNEELLWEKAAG